MCRLLHYGILWRVLIHLIIDSDSCYAALRRNTADELRRRRSTSRSRSEVDGAENTIAAGSKTGVNEPSDGEENRPAATTAEPYDTNLSNGVMHDQLPHMDSPPPPPPDVDTVGAIGLVSSGPVTPEGAGLVSSGPTDGSTPSCPDGMDVVMKNSNGPGCTFCAMSENSDECRVACKGSALCQCPGDDGTDPEAFDECCESKSGKCCKGCPGADAPECNVSTCTSTPRTCSVVVCPQGPLMRIDRRKEKRKWRRAWRKWKLLVGNKRYSFHLSQDGNPFYRTTDKKMSIPKMFQEIKRLLNEQIDFFDFKIKYQRKFGYPYLIRYSYSDGVRIYNKKLKTKKLRMRSITPDPDPKPPKPEPLSTLDWVKEKRDLWKKTEAGSSGSYTFTYRFACGLCPPDQQRPRHVTVHNGIIQEPTLYASESGNPMFEINFESTPTIDEILDELIEGLDGGWDNYSVDLEFHHLGFPTKAVIENNTLVADSLVIHSVSDLEYLPEACPSEEEVSDALSCDHIGHKCYYGQESCKKTFVSMVYECMTDPDGDGSLGQFIGMSTDACFRPS